MKRIQLEPWTTWEKLCLANAVQRTGDQNWTAVGRAVKNIYDDTMVYLGNEARPSHWFSMKQCAAQYETLLNSVLGSRRKKRTEKSADPHEQPSHLIYNILKNEFLDELDRKIEEDRILYKKMKKKQEDILAGLYDDKLEEMIAEDAREKERDIKLKLKFKLGEKNAERNSSPIKSYTPTTPEGEVVKPPGSNSSTSPLLTSLLQSPSQHSLPATPSISLLLNSAPSTPSNESPTLSKLLESPSSKVPLNATSSLTPSALPGLSPSALPGLSPSAGVSQLDAAMRSIPRTVTPTETHRITSTSPQKLVPTIVLPPTQGSPPKSHHNNPGTDEKGQKQTSFKHVKKLLQDSSSSIQSEIVIEEDLLLQDKKQNPKKSDNEAEEEEDVIESVEEILEKLKEAIIETVGPENDPDIEVISEQVNKGDEGIEHVQGILTAAEIKQEEDEEMERGTSSHTGQQDDSDDESDERQEEASTSDQVTSGQEDKVFTDDEKIDADILAEAKSVVDRRMSDSEPQELGDLVQISAKQMDQTKEPTTAPAIEHERDVDDQVEIGDLDQQAVEIIVMGSNTNSVVNVLSLDSSSEEVTMSGVVPRDKDQNLLNTPIDQDPEASVSTREEDDEEEKHTSPPQTPSAGGDEESQSSIATVDKLRDDKDDYKEEEREEFSSKEEETQPEIEDSSSKDDHVSDFVSSRDDGGDSSSAPETMGDQETTSDSVPNQPSPSPMSISSREHMPEVKITLEPLEITLSQGSFKEDIKNTPVLEKIRRQSTRKRSSAHLDSKPTSPASISFLDDEKEYRAWKKSVLLVFSRIASHRYASVFSKPITDTAGYKALIKCPMDLSTIKRNIETGIIRSTIDFQRDVLLMIQNAVVYNTYDSPVYNMALEMWNDVVGQMNVMVQAVGDGVLLGGLTVQGDTPGRPTRRQQSLDNKKTGQTPPTHSASKRRKMN